MMTRMTRPDPLGAAFAHSIAGLTPTRHLFRNGAWAPISRCFSIAEVHQDRP